MSLKLGAYTACLHNYDLAEALDILKGYGLDGAEVNVGGFIPSPHCHVDLLVSSETAREEYRELFADKGMQITGMNCSGNVLDPLSDVGPRHHYDLKRAIELASKLGVDEIVCMSGAPGSDPDAKYPSWVVNPWNGVYLEVLHYQQSVLDKYWKEMDKRAADAGVKLAWELHPHNTVFTPVGFMNFLERVQPTNIGVNMDPSHLMWQGMDIFKCIDYLGEHIYHVHAKDTKILPDVDVRGVLDDNFTKWPDENPYPSGMAHYCSTWAEPAPWRFVAVGNGHDTDWWAEFLRHIEAVNPNMNVNIEHEDPFLDQLAGIEVSAKTLLAANKGK